MNNAKRCRRLIDDLLTAQNPDGSLKHPRGLFVSEIKAELDPSWGWGDIGAALNSPPLPPKPGEKPVILMGVYDTQNNGYAAKRWTVVTAENPYVTRSMRENVRTAETQIKKLINNRLKPALTVAMYAQGDADDLPAALGFLNDAVTDISRACKAGDERAARLKAERAAKASAAAAKTAEEELAAVKAKLAEVEAKLAGGT